MNGLNDFAENSEAREALHIKPGTKLDVVVRRDMVILMRRPKSFADALRGIARFSFPPDYLENERNDW